jgi:hypothetical protein
MSRTRPELRTFGGWTGLLPYALALKFAAAGRKANFEAPAARYRYGRPNAKPAPFTRTVKDAAPQNSTPRACHPPHVGSPHRFHFNPVSWPGRLKVVKQAVHHRIIHLFEFTQTCTSESTRII